MSLHSQRGSMAGSRGMFPVVAGVMVVAAGVVGMIVGRQAAADDSAAAARSSIVTGQDAVDACRALLVRFDYEPLPPDDAPTIAGQVSDNWAVLVGTGATAGTDSVYVCQMDDQGEGSVAGSPGGQAPVDLGPETLTLGGSGTIGPFIAWGYVGPTDDIAAEFPSDAPSFFEAGTGPYWLAVYAGELTGDQTLTLTPAAGEPLIVPMQ